MHVLKYSLYRYLYSAYTHKLYYIIFIIKHIKLVQKIPARNNYSKVPPEHLLYIIPSFNTFFIFIFCESTFTKTHIIWQFAIIMYRYHIINHRSRERHIINIIAIVECENVFYCGIHTFLYIDNFTSQLTVLDAPLRTKYHHRNLCATIFIKYIPVCITT